MYYNVTIVVNNYQYQNKKENHLRSNIAKGWKKLKKRKPSKEAFEKQGELEEAFENLKGREQGL